MAMAVMNAVTSPAMDHAQARQMGNRSALIHRMMKVAEAARGKVKAQNFRVTGSVHRAAGDEEPGDAARSWRGN
jgi:hypothetical protein